MNNIENYIKKICYCRLKKPNKMGARWEEEMREKYVAEKIPIRNHY